MATNDTDDDPMAPGNQGHFLAEWLEHLDLEQKDLVERTRMDKTAISRRVKDHRRLPTYELRKFAAALGLRPEALLHHPNDMSPAARASRMSEDALRGMIRRELGD